MFSYFYQKIGFDTSCRAGDNLHKITVYFLGKIKKKIQSIRPQRVVKVIYTGILCNNMSYFCTTESYYKMFSLTSFMFVYNIC